MPRKVQEGDPGRNASRGPESRSEPEKTAEVSVDFITTGCRPTHGLATRAAARRQLGALAPHGVSMRPLMAEPLLNREISVSCTWSLSKTYVVCATASPAGADRPSTVTWNREPPNSGSLGDHDEAEGLGGCGGRGETPMQPLRNTAPGLQRTRLGEEGPSGLHFAKGWAWTPPPP